MPCINQQACLQAQSRPQPDRLWLRHHLRCAALLLLGMVSSGVAAASQEVPPPEQVFRVTLSAASPTLLRAQWHIAPGYYLYRDKIRFKSQDPAVQLGAPHFPPAHEIKHDEFFGEMAIYRRQLTVDLPIKARASPQAVDLDVVVVSQGCADIGVCYPPLTQTLPLTLPAVAGQTSEGRGEILSSLSLLLGRDAQAQEFLPPEQAFRYQLKSEGDTLKLQWDIAEGYFLYRDKFGFSLKDSPGLSLGTYSLPAGTWKTDPLFGRSEVYYRQLSIDLPLLRTDPNARQAQLQLRYQGCADAGFCYPPTTAMLAVNLGNEASGLAPPTLGTQDRYALSLAQDNHAKVILLFYGLGLLLAFTPCVFPMIPILSSIIAAQGKMITTRKAWRLSLTYVLAMSLTYTLAGMLAGLFGQNLQAAFQNPWILGAFSAIFVLLALAMFGFYELQLPGRWQSKLAALSHQQQAGTYLGTGIMGILSALIVGPCVAAPLAGALIYIGQSGDAVLGGLALFALSLGMGTPLLVVGTSTGKWLPKAGAWMNNVKAVFGVLLLGVAIWMLERIVPAQITMLLWASLLIGSAVYMGAFSRLDMNATGWHKLWKSLGLVILIYGGLIMVGAASGGKDVLQPLRGIGLLGGTAGAATQNAGPLAYTRVKGLAGLQQALAQARAEGKAVMLDFYADWCVSCKVMERTTFADPTVQMLLSNMVVLQADITANDAEDQALLKHFGLYAPPTLLFFGTDGAERRAYRIVGEIKTERFISHLQSFQNTL